MAIKRNLATTGAIAICGLAGAGLLLSSIFGTSPAELKREKETAAMSKELGTGGAVDPKAAANKLVGEIASATAEKTRKDHALREQQEQQAREKAARDLALAQAGQARGLPSGGSGGVGANGYPAGTPNGGAGGGYGSGNLSGSALQNATADEQARLAREIQANVEQAALRGAKTAAFEDSSVAMVGNMGAQLNSTSSFSNANANNANTNRIARSAGLPSVEELVRMGNAAAANGGSTTGSGNGAASGVEAMRSALLSRAIAGDQAAPEPTAMQRNASFMKEVAAGAGKAERDKATVGSFPRAPLSKFMLTEGWSIPAVLSRGINSDLAGDFTAVVTQKVYDSVSGTVCLIPQGSTLLGKYNSEVAAGQERLLFAVTGLRYPNGTYVPLGSMNASDSSGASGLAGNVNNHFFKIFGSSMAIAAVSTVASVISSRSQAGNIAVNVGNSMTGNSASVLSDVTKKMLDRNTNIKPTIRLGVGEKFTVSIAHDLVLPPYLTNPNCN
jgi:type IV secretory pathway VirB10-like protein